MNHPRLPDPYERVARSEHLSGAGTASFEVPIERCITRYLFTYRTDGWHPLVAALDHVRHRSRMVAFLAAFYEGFQPRTLDDLFAGAPPSVADRLRSWPVHPAILGRLWNMNPWLLERRLHTLEVTGWEGKGSSIYVGPQPQEVVDAEVDRLRDLHTNVTVSGYRPAHRGHRIAGYFLVRGEDYRFLLCSGNHRVAVLRALGYSTCTATFMPGWPYAVNEEQLHRWTTRHGGVYTPEVASWLFARHFAASGREIADRIALP